MLAFFLVPLFTEPVLKDGYIEWKSVDGAIGYYVEVNEKKLFYKYPVKPPFLQYCVAANFVRCPLK